MAGISVDIERPEDEDDERPHAETARRHPNTCPRCSSHFRDDELIANLRVCTHCGFHFAMPARERLASLLDAGSFAELGADLRSVDPLAFIDLKPYTERLTTAELATGEGDAIVTGSGAIAGLPVAIAVMEFRFLGGSMGSVVGERFCLAVDRAIELDCPLIAVASSGGARMQENILALMQMAKTVVAIDALRDARLPFVTISAHPTTGGVIASFASLGDIALAEPGALMSFAGPRVVEQTTREQLPADFGLAESNLKLGHVDEVVERGDLRERLIGLVRLFSAPVPQLALPAAAEPEHPPWTRVPESLRKIFSRRGER